MTMPGDTDARFATEEYLRHIMLDYRQMADFVKEPFVIARADGIRLWDVHGKEYLDGLAGIFAVNDPSALGVRAALESAGKAEQVKIIGFDGQPEGNPSHEPRIRKRR